MVDTQEKKVGGAKKKVTNDEDVINALNPKHRNQLNSGYSNESKASSQEDKDNILNQLAQFGHPQPEQQENPVQFEEEVGESLLEEAPSPPSTQLTYYNQNPELSVDSTTGQIEEIAESIVDEKWEDFLEKIGDINLWKENVNNELISVKQEIIRTQDRFTNLQRAILGKVNEYNQSISNISTEMKALEQVFQKILQPLTSNIKELSRITEKLKKKS